MEDLSMEDDLATTSINHSFIVDNPESVAKFAKALLEAANDPPRPISCEFKCLKDPDEIRECIHKVNRTYEERAKADGEK